MGENNYNYKNLDFNIINELGSLIEKNDKFVIISHLRPDGDAIGSQIAMGIALIQMGKNVKFINEHGVPDKLKFLENADLVLKPDEYEKQESGFQADIIMILDTTNRHRIGESTSKIIEDKLKETKIINIDHHVSNDRYGDLNLIDADASSTGEMIFKILKCLKIKLNKEILTNLFVAISTDTGSFKYSNTSPETFKIISEISEYNVDTSKISKLLYDTYPLRKLLLIKELLGNIKFVNNNLVASFTLTTFIKNKLSIKPEDTEGIIDLPRGVDGVIVVVFIDEIDCNNVRVSMRSNDNKMADVNKICQTFGGGGHSMAAGASINLNYKEAEKKIIKNIIYELQSK